MADPLPNDVLGWMLPNAPGDPAGVVEKGLLDMPLPNAPFGADADMLASPLGALDFPKILLVAPFVPKPELPNPDAGAGAAVLLAFSLATKLLDAPPKPELPNTGTGAAAMLASSFAVFAAPNIDNGAPFCVSPPDAAVANADVPDCGPKLNVGFGADEAPVEPNAEPPEGPNENLGFSVSSAAALGTSEVSVGLDAAFVLLPDPNTGADEG